MKGEMHPNRRGGARHKGQQPAARSEQAGLKASQS